MNESLTASIKISYWTLPMPDNKVIELEGIDEFRQDLIQSYVSVVQSRPGDRGGGLYELAVEFISSITLQEFSSFILAGMAYDLLKSGSKEFILRPFLAAYNKLKKSNPEHEVEIESLKIVFQDATVIIYKISKDSIYEHLESILSYLARHSHHLILREIEWPFEIHIPVFEDPAADRISRFRVKLDVDETIPLFSKEDYFGYWGLYYNFSYFRVYDVQNKILLQEEFYNLERYWQEMTERWRRNQHKPPLV